MKTGEIGYVDERAMWMHAPADAPVRLVEERLRSKGLTLGAQPPSIFRGSVREWIEGPLAGRWVEGGRLAACVASVKVILDDGAVLGTVAAPRSAAGPALTQLFQGTGGKLGEVSWVVLRARRRWQGQEEVSFSGEADEVFRWLQLETQRIEPPLRVELRGGSPVVASLHFPADTGPQRARVEAAAKTARDIGLSRADHLGVFDAERPWEREVPADGWLPCVEALGEGRRLGLCRIARESAVAVAVEEVGAALPILDRRDDALATLESRLVSLLRPH